MDKETLLCINLGTKISLCKQHLDQPLERVKNNTRLRAEVTPVDVVERYGDTIKGNHDLYNQALDYCTNSVGHWPYEQLRNNLVSWGLFRHLF